mmetsp:Transcript_29475/g.91138  ORF Transcript_29475/g.91138 Transcript_29475/m.91138 type:complete len:308 (+) Transcript_29475:1-924(+)
MAASAALGLASSQMTPWFCAPRFAWTRLPLAPARRWMCAPAASPPTNEIARIRGSSQRKFTASCAPWMTFKTPSGRPASAARSASIIAVSGTFSDGLRTNVLPAVTASGNIQSGIMAGKLNGATPAQTPNGRRYEWQSTPVPTLGTVSPMVSVGREHACSTTSRPRKMSPFASSSVLPCSSDRQRASSSVCSRISASYLCMTRARLETDVALQAGNAAAAASTAAVISACVASGTRVSTSCVAGQRTSTKSLAVEFIFLPLMMCGTASAAATAGSALSARRAERAVRRARETVERAIACCFRASTGF